MGPVSSKFGKVSIPGHRFTARRRIHTGNPKAIAQHNRRVGEVLYAFNYAQASFFLVFWRLVDSGKDNDQFASDLWDGQGTDLGQRKMLEVYIRHAAMPKRIQNALLWALAAMNELAERRNDAVHADFIWYYDQLGSGLIAATRR